MRGTLLYLGSRLLQSIVVLWVIVTLLFLLFRLMPGSPLVAYIDPTFTREQQQELLRQFGLDESLPMQYVIYLGNLLQGEFGDSFFHRDPVGSLLLEVLPNTLYLTLTALIVAYLAGVLGGIVLAWRRGTRLEKSGVVLTLMTRAAPDFWVGMILLVVFAGTLQWLPSSGATSAGTVYASELDKLTSVDFWRHLILPATTLAIYLHGLPLLLMRSNMLEVMQDDFVTMNRLMGYSEARIMRRVARNALLPVVTALALAVGYSIEGNVVIENVFGWPGLGRMLVTAVAANDYPLAQGAFVLIAVVMVTMNFLADVLYGVLDPRVATSGRRQA
ncbi:MAG: ABC transporter permease [Gaiellaceae bacterium]